MATATQNQVTQTAGGNYDTPVGVGGTINNNTGSLIPSSITSSSLTPTSSIQLPPAPAPVNYSGAITNANTVIGANTAALTPSTATGQPDEFTSLFNQYLGSQSAPPSASDTYAKLYGASGVAGAQNTFNTDQAALKASQAKLDAVNAQIQGLSAESQGAQVAVEGQGGLSMQLSGRQAEIARQYAVRAIPLQVQALGAQADVAAAQGNAQLSQSILQQAQSHLDTVFQLTMQDAQNQYQYKQGVVKSIYDFANAEEQRKLDYIQHQNDQAFQVQMENLQYQHSIDKSYIDAKIQAQVNMGIDPTTGQPLGGGSATGNVPPMLQPYYKTSYDGTPYVDLSSLSPAQKNQYAQIASNSGIKPVLTAEDADKVAHIAVAKSNLSDILDAFTAVPTEKQGVPAAQGVSNAVKSFFGDPTIRAYQNYRTSAINTLQALAGGSGSGFRITQSEIGAAIKDIPVLVGPNADTPASAQKKIDNLNSQIDKWQTQILGAGNHPANATNPVPSGYTTMTGPGGTYHVPNDKVDIFRANGYQ